MILVLGGFVIFGLGFALGLHYAQNLYLMEDKFVQSEQILTRYDGDISKTPTEYKFFYELKKPPKQTKGESDKDISSEQSKGKSEPSSHIEKRDLKQPVQKRDPYVSGYTIQVYSFKSQEISERMVAQLNKKGYPAYQSEIDLGSNGVYYRVRIGHFNNKSEAARILEKVIESENKEAFITRD